MPMGVFNEKSVSIQQGLPLTDKIFTTSVLLLWPITITAWKVSKYKVISGPYLNTFHAVYKLWSAFNDHAILLHKYVIISGKGKRKTPANWQIFCD